jgi:hypothetical protein
MKNLISSLSGSTILSLTLGGIGLGVGTVVLVKAASVVGTVLGLGALCYGVSMTGQGAAGVAQDYSDYINSVLDKQARQSR